MMAGSDAERVMRDAVVDQLRKLFPSARIIHELNVAGTGSSRIDVAAVTETRIIGVEIKSEKDTLARLGTQVPDFLACCDWLFVAAHRVHFNEHREEGWRAEVPSRLRLKQVTFYQSVGHKRLGLWCFPKRDPLRVDGAFNRDDPWGLERFFFECRPAPAPACRLSMLWADELRAACQRFGLSAPKRHAITRLIHDMCQHLTGIQINDAVCRQLRAREFAEADPAIPLGSAP